MAMFLIKWLRVGSAMIDYYLLLQGYNDRYKTNFIEISTMIYHIYHKEKSVDRAAHALGISTFSFVMQMKKYNIKSIFGRKRIGQSETEKYYGRRIN